MGVRACRCGFNNSSIRSRGNCNYRGVGISVGVDVGAGMGVGIYFC